MRCLPLYEADCKECGRFEAFAPVSGRLVCPTCGKEGNKRFSSFGINSGVLDEASEFLARRQQKQIEAQIATGQVESITNRGPREFHPRYESKYK